MLELILFCGIFLPKALSVLNGFAVVYIIIVLIITILKLIINFESMFNDARDNTNKLYNAIVTKFRIILVIILMTINGMMPTYKEMAALYFIPKIVNSESVDVWAKNMPELNKKILKQFLGDDFKDITQKLEL